MKYVAKVCLFPAVLLGFVILAGMKALFDGMDKADNYFFDN